MPTPYFARRRTLALSLLLAFSAHAHAAEALRFAFGPGKAPAGATQVAPDAVYSAARGYGFEPDARPDGAHPFYFSVDLPEGSYNVTVTLGEERQATATTVKSELRRLMLEDVKTTPGPLLTRTFTANV